MYFVYIIKSQTKQKFYVGYTLDVLARLQKHNEGGSIHTKDFKPWQLVMFSCFFDKSKALEYEKYLKSHSGRAFMNKRLV
jgi:predicted GIY-YIG superfamily endonuclease